MNSQNIPSYVITINIDRMRERFNAHVIPTIFNGVLDRNSKLIGALKSHFHVWNSLKDLHKPTDYVLIFEDDANLCRNMTIFDHKAINNFINKIKGNVMLLGFSPNIHSFQNTKYSKIKKGYSLDCYAYIIKVEFATYLYNKYYQKMTTKLHQKLLPLGHVDTLFLIYEVYTLYPMLYGQKDDKRYNNIFLKKGLVTNSKPYKDLVYLGFKISNEIYHCHISKIASLIVLILILVIYIRFGTKRILK